MTAKPPALSPTAPLALPVTVAELRALYAAAWPGAELDIVDDSARHAGHAGAQERGGGHYRLVAIWDGFAGVSRVERQRLAHAVAAELLAARRIHALQLQLRTPTEAGNA